MTEQDREDLAWIKERRRELYLFSAVLGLHGLRHRAEAHLDEMEDFVRSGGSIGWAKSLRMNLNRAAIVGEMILAFLMQPLLMIFRR